MVHVGPIVDWINSGLSSTIIMSPVRISFSEWRTLPENRFSTILFTAKPAPTAKKPLAAKKAINRIPRMHFF